ncbi:carbohydrate ABC transporter substrate-binding protein, CUT1 family [Actinokineospora alba]|uniref:Carbohydrate ABC transporter substrate-binding protein, CUT1 family n=1 Tax=Actinokineospora alba TaxID=504798 RepID=A0A1H0R507_9PSEU|nr:ABC transporter substrate-binding protein [Actinokineospora alba]TDP70246.1 multiple sugar transport system substrate-binding protein [Actinokineospora alba]SDI35846.1 multiple sugar transport system substrate-binding protein [Actinokineospora alba]SDP24591.1 carbohydrate ABC transporter substrate-binding protein, CUT1 family [Actinokineospora alba]
MVTQGRALRGAALAAALILGVSACGSSDSGGGGGASTAPTALEGVGPITLVTGKDTSGNLQNQVDGWNTEHPDQKVTVIELPEDADAQRQQMVQNAQTKSDAYTVLNLDVVWTAEFAANQWVAQLPETEFPLDKLLPATVETGKYFKKLYAVPTTSDGGLLYYRKDLLDAAGAKPPTTWAEMNAACDKVIAANPGLSCYAGQFEKYEGLTVNFSEAVNSAGGDVVGDDGKPNVNTEKAKAGLDFLVDGVKSGKIAAKARTFKEEEGRRAFQAGELIFHRQWPYQYAKANAADGSSTVAGKFAVAPLPGLDGPGSSTLGGHNYAISSFAKNKKTALDFIKYMVDEKQQRANLEKTSLAPTWASLYDEPALVEKFPYLTELKKSIEKAKKRPAVVKYQEVSSAIQEAAYSAMSGQATSADALAALQTKLESLTKG